MAEAINVRVTFTVEVDRMSWEMNYGNGDPVAHIRRLVQGDCEELARHHFGETIGVLKDV